jgi:hypothetical protein
MRASWLSLLLVVPALTAAAQELGQGEARITARSDVRMEIATGPGTRRSELADLGGAVGGKLAAVRGCYAERVRENPSVQGRLVVQVTALSSGRGQVEVTRDELSDGAVRSCTLDALRTVDLSGTRSSSSILVTFTFTNSAAEGHERMEERRAAEAEVTLESGPDGQLRARGGVATGEVRFQVLGPAQRREGIPLVHQAVRTAIPGLLDCRRRATRRGDSPAGEIRAVLVVGGNGRARVPRVESTVVDPHSGRCVQRVLERAHYVREGRGRYTVVVENAALATE